MMTSAVMRTTFADVSKVELGEKFTATWVEVGWAGSVVLCSFFSLSLFYFSLLVVYFCIN